MKPCPQIHFAEPISVVVPTFNEEANIAGTLAHLMASGWSEIIVSDGGSSDKTLEEICKFPQVKVVVSKQGRGVQINAGVTATSSRIVVILHADTQFPQGAVQAIQESLSDDTVVGGCFQLRFDKRSQLLNFYARMSRYESLVSTFGDQAYFFWKEDYAAVGGAPSWSLLEDVELRRRLRQRGRFVKLNQSVITSARRFEASGRVIAQVVNAILLLGYVCGIPNQRLAKFQKKFSRAG